MNTNLSPQKQMTIALDNYVDLSSVLKADMSALLDCQTETQPWRRNFIRVSASLTEGYAHCLRELCAVSLKCSAVPKITKKETKVIESEKELNAVDRIKFSLRAAYKLFELTPAPDFGNSKWLNASCLWKKRNGLMHPKTPADLELADGPWNKLCDGLVWLMEQLFKFFSLLQEKYLGCPQSGDGATLKQNALRGKARDQ
jgi:hypothetical protein